MSKDSNRLIFIVFGVLINIILLILVLIFNPMQEIASSLNIYVPNRLIEQIDKYNVQNENANRIIEIAMFIYLKLPIVIAFYIIILLTYNMSSKSKFRNNIFLHYAKLFSYLIFFKISIVFLIQFGLITGGSRGLDPNIGILFVLFFSIAAMTGFFISISLLLGNWYD